MKKSNEKKKEKLFYDELNTDNDNVIEEKFDEKEAEEFEKEVEEDIEKSKKDVKKEDEVVVGSSLGMLMQELKNYPLLTKEQERTLAKKLKTGKPGEKKIAKERLLLCNMRLVVYAAKRYIGCGVDLEDLISEGYIGLVKGINRFDYKKGFKLSTFVLYWIKQSISRAIDDQGRTVRLPVHINDKLNKYRKIKNELVNKLGYEPDNKIIAKKMKIDVDLLEQLLNSAKDTLSLDMKIGDEDDTTLGEIVADDSTILPENYAEKSDIRKRIDDALNKLKPKERFIVELRHGLKDEVPRTLEDIGKILNITRERVRQIENIAYKKLRIKAKDLESIVA